MAIKLISTILVLIEYVYLYISNTKKWEKEKSNILWAIYLIVSFIIFQILIWKVV